LTDGRIGYLQNELRHYRLALAHVMAGKYAAFELCHIRQLYLINGHKPYKYEYVNAISMYACPVICRTHAYRYIGHRLDHAYQLNRLVRYFIPINILCADSFNVRPEGQTEARTH